MGEAWGEREVNVSVGIDGCGIWRGLGDALRHFLTPSVGR